MGLFTDSERNNYSVIVLVCLQVFLFALVEVGFGVECVTMTSRQCEGVSSCCGSTKSFLEIIFFNFRSNNRALCFACSP